MIAVSKLARDPVNGSIAILLAGALAASLAAQSTSAQTVSTEEQKSTISGIVINSVTHGPIPRALVSTNDNRYAIFTDSSGHFEFDLQKDDTESSSYSPAGASYVGPTGSINTATGARVWVSARKPGFLIDVRHFRNGTVAVPGRETTISLTPEALIVGRVNFSTGDTTSHVTVQIFWKQTQDGMPRWIPRESCTTNAAGEFRFANLAPGSYKIATNESLDNDPIAALSRSQVYGFPPVYFPNSADFGTAGTIEVAEGQTIQADLSLLRQPYFPVRIPINGDLSGGMNIIVSSQGHRGPGYSLGYNMQNHRIEGMLPNGNYVVDAISYGQNSASGTTNLRVAGAAAAGSALTMVPNNGIVLNVKEEFSDPQPWRGSTQWNVGGRMVTMNGPRAYLNANLEPAEDFAQGGGSIRPPLGPNDDSLVMTEVPPGRYWLRLNSSRGYVASATMGAINVLRQPINITAGSAASVDITLRDEFASVDITVTGFPPDEAKSDERESHAWIYFVPLPDSSGEFLQTGAQAGQQFRFESLVPGNYRVLAFSRVQRDLPYRDPQAMKAYETKGQVIHATPGQKLNLQLQVIAEE